MIASLVFTSVIHPWILTILVVKELIMISGASFLYGKNVVVYSRWYGKLATVLLYLSIVSSLLCREFNISTGIYLTISNSLYGIALVVTLFALLMYFRQLYTKGFINKDDLTKQVTVDSNKK